MVSDGRLIIVTMSGDNKNTFETMKRPPGDESKVGRGRGVREGKGREIHVMLEAPDASSSYSRFFPAAWLFLSAAVSLPPPPHSLPGRCSIMVGDWCEL